MESELRNYRCVPLPLGYRFNVRPICNSVHIVGALLSDFADEQDPDVICKDCGSIIA